MTKQPPRVDAPVQVFVGSSSEASGVADAVSQELPRAAKRHKALQGLRVKPWDLAEPETTILATLERATSDSDFAIFIFTGDDEVLSRGNTLMTPRDNVLYELGLFTGALGSNSTFVLLPTGSEVKVPTDLGGVIVHPYTPVAEDVEFADLRAAVRGTCNEIAGRMNRELIRRQARTVHTAIHRPVEAPIVGAELLAVQVFADLQRGSLPALSSESEIVGRTVVHVAHGLGQVVSSGPTGEDQLAVVRFASGVMSTPVSELHLTA